MRKLLPERELGEVLVPALDGACRETGTPDGAGWFSECSSPKVHRNLGNFPCDYTLRLSPVNHGTAGVPPVALGGWRWRITLHQGAKSSQTATEAKGLPPPLAQWRSGGVTRKTPA